MAHWAGVVYFVCVIVIDYCVVRHHCGQFVTAMSSWAQSTCSEVW